MSITRERERESFHSLPRSRVKDERGRRQSVPSDNASSLGSRSYPTQARSEYLRHKDNSVQILLIGKTGNGKSSAGNWILGKSAFKVSTGILSATTRTQLGESDREHNKEKIKVQVVDFPDVCDSDLEEGERKREADICKTLTFPFPTALCLVVRADVRFTPEEYAAYQKTKELMDRGVTDNLVVVFTMADRLTPDQRDHFGQQLQQTNQYLSQVMRDASNRYVVIGNTAHHHGDNQLDAKQEDAMSQLLDVVVGLRDKQSPVGKPLRAILLGPAGSGKSATGNSLLFKKRLFTEHAGMTSNHDCVTSCDVLRGFQLEILDTPGLSSGCQSQLSRFYESVHAWLTLSSPDVIIYVINACERFSEQDLGVMNAVKQVAEDEGEVYKRLIVVFRGGDKLKMEQNSIEKELKAAPECLTDVISKANQR